MFSLPFTSDPESGTVAEGVLETLESLGCDTSDKDRMNMGMIAYNVGTLVAMKRAGKLANPGAQKNKTGRNDPCPCGSGRKYKKCCLGKNEAVDYSAADDFSVRDDTDVIPRMWDDAELTKYVEILNDLLDSEKFSECLFSQDDVAEFMEDALNEEPDLLKEIDKDNQDSTMEKIDAVAFRYAIKSGEGKRVKKIKDLLFNEVSAARSDEELRAIGCGIAFSIFEDSAKAGDSVSPLIPMLFRKALFRHAVESARIEDLVKALRDNISRDGEERPEAWLEKDLGGATHEIGLRIMENLSEDDKELIHKSFDQDHDNLWDVLEDHEFPVSLPFAAQATLLERLGKLIRQQAKPSPDEMGEAVASFSDNLLEDDYAMFEIILQNWIDENNANGQRASARIAKAVVMMQAFCKLREISEFVPTLFRNAGLKEIYSPVDDKEKVFIDSYVNGGLDDREIEEYETWMRDRGYHAAADRLMAEWRDAEDEDKAVADQG